LQSFEKTDLASIWRRRKTGFSHGESHFSSFRRSLRGFLSEVVGLEFLSFYKFLGIGMLKTVTSYQDSA
jgi:hypothetical protein